MLERERILDEETVGGEKPERSSIEAGRHGAAEGWGDVGTEISMHLDC